MDQELFAAQSNTLETVPEEIVFSNVAEGGARQAWGAPGDENGLGKVVANPLFNIPDRGEVGGSTQQQQQQAQPRKSSFYEPLAPKTSTVYNGAHASAKVWSIS